METTTQIPLKKIDDCRWEIPRDYQRGMRVPGLIFASEKLLATVRKDLSLQQVVNVAHLPGIVNYSLAMPDIHWGYGFPIGGVAATDPEQGGVISPGGIGFDINCLSGETKVLHRFGYTREIAEIVTDQVRDGVRCYRLEPPCPEEAKILLWMKKQPATPLLELTTVAGRRIVATGEHPFLARSGMKSLSELKADDEVAVDPFDGVPYERPSTDVLVDESRVLEFMRSHGKVGGNAMIQTLNVLRQRHLLPLRYSSPVLPVLIKVLGYVIGDGSLYFVGKTGKGITAFFGRGEDLEQIRKDLAPWWKVSRTYHPRRAHRIDTDYGEVRFETSSSFCCARSTSLAVLLAGLGCPVGNKAIQDYELPAWLFSAPRWQKRLFLASYFGAELQTPRAYLKRNRNFPCPLLTLQKTAAFIASGRRFLEQVAALGVAFGVRTLGINERKEKVVRKYGTSSRLRLVFSSKPDNLIALYGRIGFEYNAKRSAEAACVLAYQAMKKASWNLRRSLASEISRFRETYGVGAKKILHQLELAGTGRPESVNLRFVERTIYGTSEREVRVRESFPSYEEFKTRATEGLGDSGMVWDRICQILPSQPVEWVYDVTVNHPDHNFVANGFVVHNCGVRLLRTNLTLEQVQPKMAELVRALFQTIPCGVGQSGNIRISSADRSEVVHHGARWVVEQGYGSPEDLEHTEAGGCLADADPGAVSNRAYQRGAHQLGTLGSGNHFLEVQVVDQIFHSEAAERLGLDQGGITVMIHSGSRGFGYQICDDFLDEMRQALARYGIQVPDIQLACAPVRSPEGKRYLGAMRAAANYAWANRQCLTHLARGVFEKVFQASWPKLGMSLVYDVAHNIAKFESYQVGGKEKLLCVHRKGATRAFGPGHPELPEAYRDLGQPVIIPGDMGRNSYLLLGTEQAGKETFGTVCHGAGRLMSRTAAVRSTRGRSIEQELARKGVIVMGRGRKGIAEEQPDAYKDVNEVVGVVHDAGLARRLVRMRPLGVIKG